MTFATLLSHVSKSHSLAEPLQVLQLGWPNREVSEICFDSRKVGPGSVFVAIRGSKSDGHQFLAKACDDGAIALLVEDESQVPREYAGSVVKVGNAREVLNVLASEFYLTPSLALYCVAITGTNGKTSISNMVEAIFNYVGIATGVIGTIDLHLGDQVWATELTTPDPVSLQRTLSEFRAQGARALAMEVSSIGLEQHRSDEVSFDAAIFTNLTRDHLDYHGDMENYFQAKRRLFHDLLPRSIKPDPTAVINGDDAYGRRLIDDRRTKILSYGSTPSSDLYFETLEQGFGGTLIRLKTPLGTEEVRIRQPGRHNVYNAVAAIAAGLARGISVADAALALGKFNGVKGRLESVPNSRGLHVFIDYAHTDGAIESVLKYLREIRSQTSGKNRIITVFGCGGDRDRGKRPLMMKAASEGSDLVFVTSDNPRTEDPNAIIQEVLAGAAAADIGRRVIAVPDRRQAISEAFAAASPGDVVVIAGKGHENYQQIGTVKHPFSDFGVALEILR